MSITVERLTEEGAEERRAEILEQVGDEESFRLRGEAYQLDTVERILFEELEALDFLLGR